MMVRVSPWGKEICGGEPDLSFIWAIGPPTFLKQRVEPRTL